MRNVLLLFRPERRKFWSLVSQLDFKAQTTLHTRQSNTVCGVPLKRFGKVSETPKVKSQEFAGLLLLLVILLGSSDTYADQKLTRTVQCALSGLYVLWQTLKRPWLYKNQVNNLPGFVAR